MKKFSLFEAPITNVEPYQDVTIKDAYEIIVNSALKPATDQLRQIQNKDEARKFKANNFAFATFGGTCTKRDIAHLKEASGYMVLDFDHLDDVEGLFHQLLQDEYHDTELLFRSPSGNGLKWIISIILEEGISYGQYFDALKVYFSEKYGVEVDKSGRDILRSCFLCYDENAYINSRYIS